MKKHYWQVLMCGLVACSATALAAPSASSDRTILLPKCLVAKVSVPHQLLAKDQELEMWRVQRDVIDSIADAKHDHQTVCGGFRDVTADFGAYRSLHPSLKNQAVAYLKSEQKASARYKESDYEIRYEASVQQMFAALNPDRMWQQLIQLSSRFDRHANSDNGVATATWLKAQVEAMAAAAGRNDVTAYFVQTSGYKQPSVVVKIGDSNAPAIVVGGHMDTVRPNTTPRPGADDDGSGTVTVFELARTLISSDMRFKKPVYLIWYAAEEMGLVGSGDVVKDFVTKKIAVDNVLQLDMTGYRHQNDPTMWLIRDHVSQKLSDYLALLIKHYVKMEVKDTRCGYACSDHASWAAKGFNAGMPSEATFRNINPVLHTSQDTIDKLSLAHMTNYLKLATAFVVELAEPVS